MIKVTMNEIRQKGLVIPGGWVAKVPSVQLSDPKEVEVYLKYLIKQGYPERLAPRELQDRIQGTFTGRWLTGLREMIANRGVEWVKIHGSIRGFKPQKLQAGYFPGDAPGKRGKPAVRRMLV